MSWLEDNCLSEGRFRISAASCATCPDDPGRIYARSVEGKVSISKWCVSFRLYEETK